MDDFLETYDIGMDVGYSLLIGKHSFDEVAIFLDNVILPFDPTNEYIDIDDINPVSYTHLTLPTKA